MKLQQYQKDLIILAYPLTKNKDIAQYLNISVNTIYNYVQIYRLKKYTDISAGQKFGDLTIIKENSYRIKNQKTYLCKCICDKLIPKTAYDLITYSYVYCKCSKKKKLDINDAIYLYNSGKSLAFIVNKYDKSKSSIRRILKKNNVKLRYGVGNKYTGYKEISGTLWGNFKRGAKTRNLEFDITKEYAWQIFLNQNKKCALTGDSLFFDKGLRNSGNASLDRIDSSKGYIEGNIQWVTKKINILKRELNNEEFKQICKNVVIYNSITCK